MSANELVGIELQLKGYDGVMADMRALDQMLNGFRGKKNKLQIEADLSSAKKEIIALEGELNKLNSVKLTLAEQGKQSEGLNNRIKETRERLRDARQAVKEFQYALKNLSSMSFQQVFNKISSAVAHLGSAMQSAGNALTRLTNPFANFTKGIVMGAGYKALNKFTDGLTNGFERMDIMNKYSRNLQTNFHKTETEAKALRDSLNDAVEGLPTGLDEIVNMANQFTASMGDADRAAQLAIATNNAFLASQSGETARYQGMMQLRDVIGGKDMNAREWQSLAASMLPAIRMIGEEMGLTGEKLNKYVQDVQSGKIANEEFLDSLIKYGTSGKIVETARLAMDTWEAFFSRIRTASSRMTYGILTSLDELVKSLNLVGKDGQAIKSVNMLLDSIVIPGIDNMSASIQKWIKAHPEEIVNFFKSLKGIDFKGLVKGFGDALLGVADLVQRIAGFLNGKDLSWIGKGMLYGNILGNFLTISGGLLKGSRHLIGGIGAGGYSIFKGIKGIKKDGFFKWFGKQFIGEDAKSTEETIETVTKTAPKMGKFMTGLSNVFKGWSMISTMVGGTAVVGFVSFKAFKSMLSDLREMTDIAKDIDWKAGAAVLGGMTAFFGGFIKLSAMLGKVKGKLQVLEGGAVLGGLSLIFAGSFWADMKLIKGGFKAIKEATDYLGETIDNLKGLTKIDDVPQIKKNVQQAVAVFNSITDLLQIERNNPITGEGTSGLKELDKKSANTVKNIADSLTHMKSAIESVNAINSSKLEVGNIGYTMQSLQDALEAISTTLVNMPQIFKEGGKGESVSSGLSGTLGNIKTAFEALAGEGGILKQIPKIVGEMDGLRRMGQLEQLKGKMKDLGETLKSVYTSLQGIGAGEYFATNIDNFRAGLKSLKFAIVHLQAISGMEIDDSVVTKVQTIISKIQSAFDQNKITELSSTIDTFKQAIQTALDSFDEFNTDIEIDPTVKLGSGFQSSVNSTASKIRGANKKISGAVDDIQTDYTKRIRIHLVVSAIVSGMGAVRQAARDAYKNAKAAMPESTGGYNTRQGLLYRAKGGSVFKPRGTDTIPAMLTPGEYVHKKQAVDFFGVDFMRKVNNLDVKGAMNALLTKAGTSVGVGRQSIVNNTVNNNQRITQNISTNNPNFAGARMGRFVGAL